jgi:hypothetical protein
MPTLASDPICAAHAASIAAATAAQPQSQILVDLMIPPWTIE